MLARCLQVIDASPVLTASMTLPEIYERLEMFHLVAEFPPPPEELMDTRDEKQRLRDDINNTAHDFTLLKFLRLIGRKYQREKGDRELWESLARTIYREAYRRSKFIEGTKLKDIDDISILEKM